MDEPVPDGAPLQVHVAPSGPSFPVRRGERLLAAARRAGVWIPFECGWGSCATCKITLVEGEVEHLFPDAPAVSPRDERRRRILACQTTPRTDLVIKPVTVADSPGAERPTRDHLGELTEVEDLGPDIRRFRFRLDEDADFREGQFAVLDLGDEVRRCYSMSGLAGARHVDFVTKRYAGPGSGRLHALDLGSEIRLELPYGDMWLREGSGPVVLIAGGTGVSPILAQVRRLHLHYDPRPVDVYYGAATLDELVCREELADLVAGLPDARLHLALVGPPPGWAGITGFVTDAMAAHPTPALEGTHYYLAGPPAMVDATQAYLRERQVSITDVHYDRFG